MTTIDEFALINLNLEIKKGEFVAVVGDTGSGKLALLIYKIGKSSILYAILG